MNLVQDDSLLLHLPAIHLPVVHLVIVGNGKQVGGITIRLNDIARRGGAVVVVVAGVRSEGGREVVDLAHRREREGHDEGVIVVLE